MNNPKTWADIVSEIEKSGLDRQMEISQQERIRRQLYKNQLLSEMRQHRQRQKEQLQEKRRERSLIELKAKQDLQEQSTKRYLNKKKELDLKQQNFSLFVHQKQHKNQVEDPQTIQHPFVKLVDQQDARRAKRVYNMQESYKFNHILQKQKNKNCEIEKNKDTQSTNSHLNSINSMFDKIENNRRKYENQYLREKGKITTEPDSLQRQYAMFLNQQITEKRNQKEKQRVVTGIQGMMNSHLKQQNSSPAFLGRIPYNYDRKLQLDYLNKQLKGKKYDQKRTVTEGNHTIDSIGNVSQINSPRASPQGQTPKLPTIETRSQIGKKEEVRTFRQLNIVTGGLDYRKI